MKSAGKERILREYLQHRHFRMGLIQCMSYPQRPVLDSLHAITHDGFFDAVEVCAFKSVEAL